MHNIHLHNLALCLQVGTLPVNQPISWRGNSLTYEASQQYGFADLTGGWITGGATGNIKMTQPIAFSTSLLAWGMLKFGTGFSKGKQSNTDGGLENVMWGADYLMKTFRTGNAAQTSTAGLTIVYQVPALAFPAAAAPGRHTQCSRCMMMQDMQHDYVPCKCTCKWSSLRVLHRSLRSAFADLLIMLSNSYPDHSARSLQPAGA